MNPPCTRLYTHPFFEATPPGAAPGPPVKPGPVFVASGGVIMITFKWSIAMGGAGWRRRKGKEGGLGRSWVQYAQLKHPTPARSSPIPVPQKFRSQAPLGKGGCFWWGITQCVK